MPRLLLIRHGQSEWNAAGRWQGQADPNLTPLGEHQARAAAEAIAALGVVVAVASSDLRRARATAEIIATGADAGAVAVDAGFRERHVGEWSGLTNAEIETRDPGYLADGRRPPGFEPDADVLARVLPALRRAARLARAAADAVVVVTHAGVVYTVEAHLGQERVPLANLGGRWLDVSDQGVLALGPRVELIDPHEVARTAPSEL